LNSRTESKTIYRIRGYLTACCRRSLRNRCRRIHRQTKDRK
jgi:hypothetical protein